MTEITIVLNQDGDTKAVQSSELINKIAKFWGVEPQAITWVQICDQGSVAANINGIGSYLDCGYIDDTHKMSVLEMLGQRNREIKLDGEIVKTDFFNTTSEGGFNWNNFERGARVWTEDCDEIAEIFVVYAGHNSETVNLQTLAI